MTAELTIQNSAGQSVSKFCLKMKPFMENPGFYHVAKQILGHVDFSTLTQCREVSRNWLNFVDFHLFWWKLKLRQIKAKVKCLKTYPRWNKIFYHFENNADNDNARSFVEFMHQFLKEGNTEYKTPFAYANQVQNWDFVQILLSTPYDFEEKLNDSNTILHILCQSGHISLLQIVLNAQNLNFNITDDYGNTPLHVACCSGQFEVVKLLLQIKSVDVNATSDDGWTPLHESVFIENSQIVELFLQNAKNLGLNTNVADVNGNTPLNLATEIKNKEIVELFRKYIVDQ